MLNFMTCNFTDSSKHNFGRLDKLLKTQIENSLELGWNKNEIIIVSNKDYEHMGIKAFKCDLNTFCLTGSKMFGLKWFIEQNAFGEVIWSHDLDAWQNVSFECPEMKDVGIAQYSNGKYNGGSIFWGPKSDDIIKMIVDTLIKNNERREEPTLNKTLKLKEISNRVTIVNNTFNVGCSGYVVRYKRSELPIKVCHFHPDNRIAWETHALDRNKIGEIGISKRLESVIRKYYDNLATQITGR